MDPDQETPFVKMRRKTQAIYSGGQGSHGGGIEPANRRLDRVPRAPIPVEVLVFTTCNYGYSGQWLPGPDAGDKIVNSSHENVYMAIKYMAAAAGRQWLYVKVC